MSAAARIAVLADTHMPRGMRRLDDELLSAVRSADLVIHAGDFFGREVYEHLAELAPRLVAVHGNVDEPRLRALLPERARLEVAGMTIAVIHDAGPARGRLERLRGEFPDADAVVFGHSHLPLHERDGSFQIFNPGSPTERRRAPERSFGIAAVNEGRLSFRHVALP